MTSSVRTGLEILAAARERSGESFGGPLLRRLRGAKVGVLTHAASVDTRHRHLLEVVAELGVVPHTIFGPEHGFGGGAQDMASVGDALHPSGARIVSLYGDEPADLVPRPGDLAPLDILLVDLVDVGARYYTFVWTALLALRAAAAAGVHTVLLDRPNPLGGVAIEGRTQSAGFCSFVGWEPVPIRHGLTLAEIVLLHAGDLESGPGGAVSAVPVRGWRREEAFPATGLPWVLPSPNMPTFETAQVYPGGCLLEGTNLSEGRGHTRPFEIVGAPFLDGERWARELAAMGLGGFVARPLVFVPTFHKHAKAPCGGVQIHVTDPMRFRPVATYVTLVALAHRQAPERFRFRTERYEYVDDIPAFDLLTGSSEARLAIESGADARDIAEHVSAADPAWPERVEEAIDRVRRAAW
jgi:uncharacterized protein YbbC (DUF1343 family)